MTVPEDDDVGVGEGVVQLGGRRAAELISVRHRDRKPVQLDLGDLRNLGTNVEAVGVPIYSRDGRNRLQLDDQVPIADVTAVEYVIDVAKHLEDLRPQHPVCIRDDAEPHETGDTVT